MQRQVFAAILCNAGTCSSISYAFSSGHSVCFAGVCITFHDSLLCIALHCFALLCTALHCFALLCCASYHIHQNHVHHIHHIILVLALVSLNALKPQDSCASTEGLASFWWDSWLVFYVFYHLLLPKPGSYGKVKATGLDKDPRRSAATAAACGSTPFMRRFNHHHGLIP